MRKILLSAALLASGVMIGMAISAPPPAAATGRPGLDLSRLRTVNLAHLNDPATTPIFPGDPEFTLTTISTVPEDGYYMQYVEENEHTGTHWDAPCHFEENGLCADQLRDSDLLLPAIRIDMRAQAAADADYQITVADLKTFEHRHGRIPRGSAVLAWFGWDVKWGSPAYENADADGNVHQPGFSEAAVRWLIDTGRLAETGALGSDTYGPDPGLDPNYTASSLVLKRHRLAFPNMANLGALPPTGAYVLVGGTINKNGSGSTATIWGLMAR